MSMNRRDFVGRTAMVTAATTIGAPAILARTALGQDVVSTPVDQEVRIGVVGVNGRGNSLMQGFHNLPDARVVALCDVDKTVLDRRAAEITDKGAKVQTYGDFRKMIESDDVDAVVIATPNHWHALMAVWACDAGKDVYVEKPVSHKVAEGRAIVAAAQRNGRIVQTGTQGRSSNAVRQAVEYAHSGEMGKVLCARGLCYKPRRSIGKVDGPQFVPSTIDYHRWLGPAPYEPLNRRRLHYDWHWYTNTGNGDLGNQGVHQMDIARWGSGHNRLPDRAWSAGGRVGYFDDGNTPNTEVIVLEYKDGPPIIFEVRGLPQDLASQSDKWSMDRHHGMGIGVVLHLEGGEIRIPNTYNSAVALDHDGTEIRKWEGGGNHLANFTNAVRSGEPDSLTAPIIEGHLSSACCHVGSVSNQLGEPGTITECYESARSDYGRESVGRMNEHLRANGIDGDATLITVGRHIPIDSARETSSDPYASALFVGTHRPPFTFPAYDS